MSTEAPKPSPDGSESPFPTSGAAQGTPAPPSPPSAATARPAVVDSVRQGAHQTIDQLADGTAAQVKNAQESITKAAENLQQSAKQWRESSEEWAECLRVTVRETPLTAIATALAIGLLIARLTR